MKALMAVFMAVGFALVSASCNGTSGGGTTTTTQRQYSCPMGCVTTAKPGKCPKCGMEMTQK